LIFAAGLLLRVLFLETVPTSVTSDELNFGGNALQVMAGQGPGLLGLDWAAEPALGLHFVVGSWALFGQTLFAERLVAAVLTAVALIPFYALLRRVVTTPSALLASLLFVSSRWLLLFSRTGGNNGYGVLFLLLAAWSLTLALERTQTRYWLGLGGALAILLYGSAAGRALVLPFTFYLVALGINRWRAGNWVALRRIATGFAAAVLTVALLFLPEAPTVAHHWQLFNPRRGMDQVFTQSPAAGETPSTLLAGNLWTAARSFLFMDPTVDSSLAPGAARTSANFVRPGDAWLDPITASLYLAGLVLGLRRRAMALWWCLLLIPLALTQGLGPGTPDGASALTAVAPMFAFVALAIDAAGRLWATGRPAFWRGTLLLALLVGAYNVYTYVSWVDSPAGVLARQPAVAVSGFYTWRDFQIARLKANVGILPPSQYDKLSLEAVAAQIAGVAGFSPPAGTIGTAAAGAPSGPPVNGPPQANMARQIAVIGTPGAAVGDINQPRDVAMDRLGNLYVADSGRGRVVVYAPDGHVLREWAPIAGGQPFTPWAIVAVPDNSVFVLDSGSGRVGHFDSQGQFLGLVALPNPSAGSRGLSLGLDGELYLAQTPANQVIRLTSGGAVLPPLGNAASGKVFDQPTSAIATSNGVVFVYQPDSGHLLLITADGRLLFTLQAPHVATFDAGRLAVLPDGRVLLADVPGQRILVYASDGRLLGSFPVAGIPQGIAVGPAGSVAVTDEQSKLVRVYALGG
jgi:hypothetical protein